MPTAWQHALPRLSWGSCAEMSRLSVCQQLRWHCACRSWPWSVGGGRDVVGGMALSLCGLVGAVPAKLSGLGSVLHLRILCTMSRGAACTLSIMSTLATLGGKYCLTGRVRMGLGVWRLRIRIRDFAPSNSDSGFAATDSRIRRFGPFAPSARAPWPCIRTRGARGAWGPNHWRGRTVLWGAVCARTLNGVRGGRREINLQDDGTTESISENSNSRFNRSKLFAFFQNIISHGRCHPPTLTSSHHPRTILNPLRVAVDLDAAAPPRPSDSPLPLVVFLASARSVDPT
jgi:hypothetical protein